MRSGRSAVLCLLAVTLWSGSAAAQHGVDPKPKPEDYPVHADAGGVKIAAEYLVRSVGGERDMFVIKDHLVVQVALYPQKGKPLDISNGHFRLLINGKKNEMRMAQAPGMVAAAMKYDDWAVRRNLEVGGGYGDSTVILGRPRQQPRFPGDRRETDRRPTGSATINEERPDTPEARVVELALPEGPAPGPVAGHLYFVFTGKPKKIKSLELIYDTGERKAALRLF